MANGPRRIGVLGLVTIALLVALGVVAFVRITSGSQPPRRCSGGAAVPAPDPSDDPVQAIRQFAPQARPPAYIHVVVPDIPIDGWVRRSDVLYEHDAVGSRILQVDLATTDGRTRVTGLWLCTPSS